MTENRKTLLITPRFYRLYKDTYSLDCLTDDNLFKTFYLRLVTGIRSTLIFSSYGLIFTMVGSFGIFVKYLYFNQMLGFLIAVRYLGKSGVEELNILEYLSLFRNDILLNLIIVPFLSLLIVKRIKPKIRLAFAIIVPCLLFEFFFTEMMFVSNVGRFLSIDMLKNVVQFGLDHPSITENYISLSALIKNIMIVILIIILAFLAEIKASNIERYFHKCVRTLFATLFLASCTLTFMTFSFPIQTMTLHESVIAMMGKSLFDTGNSMGEFKNMTMEETIKAYRSFTQTPVIQKNSSHIFSGKEMNSDVIFFIFETGPSKSFEIAGGIQTLPGVSSLLSRSFVAANHYSTYPYTTDALFSIFNSLYPVGTRRMTRNCSGLADLKKSSFFDSIKSRRYVSAIYGPNRDSFEDDTLMFNSLGLTRRFIAQETEENISDEISSKAGALFSHFSKNTEAFSEKLLKKLTLDMIALEELKKDILQYKRNDQAFAAAFLPQIGHGPWPDLYNISSIPARGRAIIELQDQWLNEIIQLLKSNGWLEDTIIVITADHGIRTISEDPAFEGGKISEYSFHVPLIIYAPHTVVSSENISSITSHIDIKPTILELMGIADCRQLDQGVPIWNNGIPNRKTFFFAGGYLGADAYHEGGHFFMSQNLVGAKYRNTMMDFPMQTFLPFNGLKSQEIESVLTTMYELQNKFGRLLIESSAISSR